MPIDGFDNRFRVIARIDADRSPGFLAADNARVLLKSGGGDFFDDHSLEQGLELNEFTG